MQSKLIRIPLDLVKEIETVMEPREHYGDTIRRIISIGIGVMKAEELKEQIEFEADFAKVVERVESNKIQS